MTLIRLPAACGRSSAKSELACAVVSLCVEVQDRPNQKTLKRRLQGADSMLGCP
jgi:hypothetical protein